MDVIDDALGLPPLLQVLLLSALWVFTLLSLTGRFVPALERIWREPAHERGLGHWVEYTVVPAVLSIAGTWAAWRYWDPTRPWLGGWSAGLVAIAIGGCGGGIGMVIASELLKRRTDLSDARSLRAWLPLLLMLGGIALLVVGIVIPAAA